MTPDDQLKLTAGITFLVLGLLLVWSDYAHSRKEKRYKFKQFDRVRALPGKTGVPFKRIRVRPGQCGTVTDIRRYKRWEDEYLTISFDNGVDYTAPRTIIEELFEVVDITKEIKHVESNT